jgi:hypothetical protein
LEYALGLESKPFMSLRENTSFHAKTQSKFTLYRARAEIALRFLLRGDLENARR